MAVASSNQPFPDEPTVDTSAIAEHAGAALAPKPQPRVLSDVERQQVRDTLHSDRFVDKAPAQVYAELLDEGRYLASESTMYRILRADGEVGERRRQATHPAHVKPELVATKPNQCWSWDITKLHGPQKWTYYYLYVIIDIHSATYPAGCSHPASPANSRNS